MAKISDVVITCFKAEWEVFANDHKYNPFLKLQNILPSILSMLVGNV